MIVMLPGSEERMQVEEIKMVKHAKSEEYMKEASRASPKGKGKEERCG